MIAVISNFIYNDFYFNNLLLTVINSQLYDIYKVSIYLLLYNYSSFLFAYHVPLIFSYLDNIINFISNYGINNINDANNNGRYFIEFLYLYSFFNEISYYINIYYIYYIISNISLSIFLFNSLIVIFFIFFLSILLFSVVLNDIFIKNITMLYFFISNEIESNLISIIDFFFIMISFIYLFNFINFTPSYTVLLSSIFIFFIFFIINIISIFSYISVFNINIFVFLSGLQFKLNLIKWLIVDISNSIVFVLRILLQYIRLVLCSIFFFLLQELFDFFKSNSVYYNINEYYNFIKITISNFITRVIQVLLELLDTTTNISMQIIIFIVVVVWLMPFLFSNIKKKNKVIITNN